MVARIEGTEEGNEENENPGVKGPREVVLGCSGLPLSYLRLWIEFPCIRFAKVSPEPLMWTAFRWLEIGWGGESRGPASISSIG